MAWQVLKREVWHYKSSTHNYSYIDNNSEMVYCINSCSSNSSSSIKTSPPIYRPTFFELSSIATLSLLIYTSELKPSSSPLIDPLITLTYFTRATLYVIHSIQFGLELITEIFKGYSFLETMKQPPILTYDVLVTFELQDYVLWRKRN